MADWRDALSDLLHKTTDAMGSELSASTQHFLDTPTPNSPWQGAVNSLEGLGTPLHMAWNAVDPRYIPINSPGDAIGDAVKTLQLGANAVQGGIGLGANGIFQAIHSLGLGDRKTQEQFINAYQQGGGRAVWDLMMTKPTSPLAGVTPSVAAFVATLGSDPLTYMSAGVPEVLARALAAGAEFARLGQGVGTAEDLINAGLQAPEGFQELKSGALAFKDSPLIHGATWFGQNAPGGQDILRGAATGIRRAEDLVNIPGEAISDAGRAILGKVGRGIGSHTDLLKYSKTTQVAMNHDRLHDLLQTDIFAHNRLNELRPGEATARQQYRLGNIPPESTATGEVSSQTVLPGFQPPNTHTQLPMAIPPTPPPVMPEDLHPELSALKGEMSHSTPGVDMLTQLRANHDKLSHEANMVRSALTDPITGKPLYGVNATETKRLNLADQFDLANPAISGSRKIGTILRDWKTQYHMDPLYGDPAHAAVAIESKAFGKSLGIEYTPSNLRGLAAAAWRESALASPRFHLNNLLNGVLQNAMMGVNTHVEDFFDAYHATAPGIAEPNSLSNARAQFRGEQTANIYGTTLPDQVFSGGMMGSDQSAVGALVGKVNRAAGQAVSVPLFYNKRINIANEAILRSAAYSDTLDAHVTSRLPDIDALIKRALPDSDYSLVQLRTPQGGLPPKPITPEQVFTDLLNEGADQGQATAISRAYAHEINVGKSLGIKRMEAAQYSYRKTNLDEAMSRFVPFSYWSTRAFPNYLEEGIRNPWLATNYMREMQATTDANNDPGLSAREKGFIRFLSSYGGFTTLLDPAAFWGVTQVFDSGQDFTPEGITPTGRAMLWLKNHGVGAYPWIDQVFNLIGTYGDTFEPDFFSIRQKSLVAAAVQEFRAATGQEPAGAPMANLMGKLRGDVSGFTSQFLPGWISQPVYQKAGLSQSEITMDKAIENKVISNHVIDPETGRTDLTPQGLAAIMSNPNSDDYHRAFREVAEAGLAQQIANFTQPFRIKVKDDQTDVRAAVITSITDAARKAGVPPWQFKPTVADVEFATGYKALTGRDWQPTAYDDATLQRDLVNAPPQAKQFVLDNHDYQNLGNDAYRTYIALKMGNDPRTKNLPANARDEYANQWLDSSRNGGAVNEVVAAKQIFRATHPEFEAYLQWRSGMSNLASQYPDGTLAQYRVTASQMNPNAQTYFAKVNADALRFYPNDQAARDAYVEKETTSVNAWMAITGQAMNRTDNIPVPLQPNQEPTDITLALNTRPDVSAPTPDWLRRLGVSWQYQ